MASYYNKIPFFVRWLYPDARWHETTSDKVLYLTFDDGPTEEVTNFVLGQLEKYNAKATFFCLGFNADNNPSILSEIIDKGHSVGNHSYSHPNGFKTKIDRYLEDVNDANEVLKAKLFRPPYGKMKLRQYKNLKNRFNIIMWDVMPGDFDVSIDGDKCFSNVVEGAKRGSIIVLHDTQQAFPRLKYVLPKLLEYYTKLGYTFDKLN